MSLILNTLKLIVCIMVIYLANVLLALIVSTLLIIAAVFIPRVQAKAVKKLFQKVSE